MYIVFDDNKPEWIIGKPGIDGIQLNQGDIHNILTKKSDFICNCWIKYESHTFHAYLYSNPSQKKLYISVILDNEINEVYHQIGLYNTPINSMITIPYDIIREKINLISNL